MPLGSLRRNPFTLLLVLLPALLVELASVSSFQLKNAAWRNLLPKPSTTSRSVGEDQISDFDRPSTFLDQDDDDGDDDSGINVVFIEDEDDDIDEDDDDDESTVTKGKGRQRWENLKPSVKKRLVDKGQAKAIANKKKREPAAEKKRRESSNNNRWRAFSFWHTENGDNRLPCIIC
jgi:hypothetical protein